MLEGIQIVAVLQETTESLTRRNSLLMSQRSTMKSSQVENTSIKMKLMSSHRHQRIEITVLVIKRIAISNVAILELVSPKTIDAPY